MRIGIRADGGKGVGLGHLSRCMALAEAFGYYGAEPVFLDVAPECRSWVRQRGWRLARGKEARWDLIVADSYRFTLPQMRGMRRSARSVLAFDDSGGFRGPCDWILNSHVYAHSLTYPHAAGKGLLLGPRFHPMRRAFWGDPKTRGAASRIRQVVVALGGGAFDSFLEAIVAATTRALPGRDIHVLKGPLSPGPRLPAGLSVTLHDSPREVRPVLERGDVAISAGGQTLYELVRLGIPTIALSLVENQASNVAGMVGLGAAISVPAPQVPGFAASLGRVLRKLDRRPRQRDEMSQRQRALIDGRGALRVARLLMTCPGSR